jgi:flagellar hook assembly protein FlgD
LMGGSMSAQFKAQLVTSIGKVAAWPPTDVTGQRLERLKMALWLIINSPEYMIQK